MDKNQYAEKFGRWVDIDEIIMEDLLEKDLLDIAEKMAKVRYNLEYWKCPRQKSGHLHIKDIFFLAELPLSPEQKLIYKRLVMQKYIPKSLWEEVDWNFVKTKRHRIAEENKEHFKGYGVKTLIKTWNNLGDDWEPNCCEEDLCVKAIKETTLKKKKTSRNYGIIAKIIEKISIIGLAEEFGFKVRGNKAICLFHNDSSPSLNFNEEKGLFYCFGCCQGGNIVDFLALCKKHKLVKIRGKENA